MALSSQHITGFFIGIGAAAAGFYVYKKNQDKVDEFLAKQGIKTPGRSNRDLGSMSLEDLVREKERLEDTIAERELQGDDPAATAASEAK